jgi:hypothetical protein
MKGDNNHVANAQNAQNVNRSLSHSAEHITATATPIQTSLECSE